MHLYSNDLFVLKMGNETSKGFILAITAATLWGVSGTFGQFLFQQRGINVEWLITVRMLFSGFCLLLVARFGEKTDLFVIWEDRKDATQLLFFSIIGMLAVQYTYFAAIKHANAATATVLKFFGPIIIVIFLSFKSRRFPKPREFVAIALAIVGTFLLVTHGDIRTLTITRPALFFGLASAVALATYTLIPVQLLAKYKSSMVIGWGMFCGGFVFSFVRAPWNASGYWDTSSYLYTVLIVVFGTLIPFYLYLNAVKIIGGQKTSLLASAEPLSAALLAIYWLGVPFLVVDWVGSFCIIATVFLLSLSDKREVMVNFRPIWTKLSGRRNGKTMAETSKIKKKEKPGDHT